MKLIAIALLFVAAPCLAGPGCEKVEYAQLKDSTKSELVEEYCVSMARANLHKKYVGLAKEAARQPDYRAPDAAVNEIREYVAAEVSCLGAAEDAARVLKRKFGTKSPSCK
jgi:hypothetical protein